MRVDFESTQKIEIVSIDGDVTETSIIVGLECTDPGYPGYFDPRTGGEPPFGPEFDIAYIAFLDEEGKSREFGSFEMMEDIAKTILGKDIYDRIVDAACEDAALNWTEYE